MILDPLTYAELLQGYGPAVKAEDEDRHMNVNVSSSGQGTKTVILQIPKVSCQHKCQIKSNNL